MTTFYIPNSIPKLNNYLSINKQLIKSWLRENCYKSLLDLKISVTKQLNIFLFCCLLSAFENAYSTLLPKLPFKKTTKQTLFYHFWDFLIAIGWQLDND